MKTLTFVLMAMLFPMLAHAEPLGGSTKVAEFRAKMCTALGMGSTTTSKLLDIVSRHIDSTDEWSLKYLTGNDIYGADEKNKAIRYFMTIIVKNGRTIVDTLAYDTKTGQLILSEVENIVMSINAGIEDSKKLADDSAYSKISESKSSAIYHKKGYLQEVAFSVNTNTNAIVKTFTDTFHETVVSQVTRGTGAPRPQSAGFRETP